MTDEDPVIGRIVKCQDTYWCQDVENGKCVCSPIEIHLSSVGEEYQSAILTFPDMMKRIAELESKLTEVENDVADSTTYKPDD